VPRSTPECAPTAAPSGPRPVSERGDGVDSLSAREIQVLQLVADGKSNKDIGEELGLSALTVKSHLARIARKLGTGDRAEMVATSMRSGVIA
jgi:DNA-binding NarL/FixJ family response regulator